MTVLIEAPFQLNEGDKNKIEIKVAKLEKYQSNITQAKVYFKLGDGIKPDSVIAEVLLHVPGPVIFVSDTAKNHMAALSGAISKAIRQLKKD